METPARQPMERWNNRALWLLVWPLMIEQLLAVTIGMVDTVMVANLGEFAVSGVSLVDSINVLVIQIFSAFATGGAVVASQYLGRKQHQNASTAARQLVYGITVVSLVLMVVALLLRAPILRLVYGTLDADVMQAAETYLWLSAITYPFIALYNAGAALFRSMGNSRVSMLIALLVNILNIGGNAILIYGLNMGVAGAAISTLISRMIAAVVLIVLLMRKRGRTLAIHLQGLFRFKLDFSMMSRILKIGVPNGLENSMFHIGKLIVARVISTFGTAAIAGNAIAIVLATFGYLPGAAIGLALLTVTGQCVGAADYAGARRYTTKLMKVAYAAMAAMAVLILIFAKHVVGLFGLSAEASQIAVTCSMIHAASAAVFWPPAFALPNSLRAAGDARFTMVVSMVSMWVFRIGSAYVFAYGFGMGVVGVWVAMAVDWVVRGGIFLMRWRGNKWQNNKVIQ